MKKALVRKLFSLSLVGLCTAAILGQDSDQEPISYSASGDAALVSKYIWRGQRLTNDFSLQPSMTLGMGNFSVNIWGNLDLAAVNEGDLMPKLFLPENPTAGLLAPGERSGLKGKFSEIDYTFSYASALNDDVSFDVGTIFYAFPERSGSLPTTTELYGSVSFDTMPLAPSATIYLDVDETSAGDGSSGLYFLLAGGHSIPFDHEVFTGLDLSVSLGIVNSGFSNYYYGVSSSGLHDLNVTAGLPIAMGDNWSASLFISFSSLLGDFADQQYLDPRKVHEGTAGTSADSANTIWGGFSLSLGL